MKTDYNKVSRSMCEDYMLHLDSESLLLVAARLQLTTDETAYLLKKLRNMKKIANSVNNK